MPTIASNLPLAARRLMRARGFTLVAVGTLALAIGANIAMFSLVEVLFLEPIPVEEPERLVGVYESRDGAGYHPLSYADFLVYREETESCAGLAAAYLGAPLELRLGDESSLIEGAVVSADTFEVLGLEPELGRFFIDEEDAGPGRQPVAVISHQLWRERFGLDRRVLGRPLSLNDTSFTIVGVAPEDARSSLRLGSAIDAWIPTSMAAVGYRWCDALDHDCTWMSLVGRLAPGAGIDDVRTELELISGRLRALHPSGEGQERGITVAPLSAMHPGDRDRSLRLAGTLLFAVSLLLVVAGASLSGLLVARGLRRRREVAVRLSLGASRADVLRLFVAETLLIGLAGGVLGLVTATWFEGLISRFYGSSEPLDLGFGSQTLLYASVLSVTVGLALGLVSGLQTSRPDLVPALRGSGSAGPGSRPRVLGGLVVAQAALALVLVTGTGLLLESIDTLRHAGAMDPERVATFRLRPRLVGLEAARAQALTHEVLLRVSELPGVRSASLSRYFTPGRGDFTAVARHGGAPPRATLQASTLQASTLQASTQPVSPGFFETVGITLLAGRDFEDGDRPGGEPVAVVNRTLAASLWPDRAAVGETLSAFDRRFRVIGVVDDDPVHLDPPDAPVPQLYTAYWQDPGLVDARMMVATERPAASMLAALRREIEAVSRELPVTEAEVLTARLRRTFTPTWLAGRVLGTTGALSLLLCALCLHGVLSLVVAQRRKDLGIRMALGASRGQVVSLVLRDALSLAAAGIGLGLMLSLALGRLLEGHLYGVSPTDPAALGAAVVVLCLSAGAAAWWPARRASRLDPLEAVRAD
ncbi:MAG TPA: ADOP family duplicated permease [Thermoanaerobaculia bacterium]|nr:ADOP family duplicated permease [Thermoanaerobaculia bacterium]